ncbi:MAG: hypothetical protein VZQ81_07105 [Succiniclasticum sp.]|jgi:hypothetical protein|nr:hypothetical protein [Succiniclasticum sp.]MEE3479773.1 hypothetical protein [Succiniclasticum sp.]
MAKKLAPMETLRAYLVGDEQERIQRFIELWNAWQPEGGSKLVRRGDKEAMKALLQKYPAAWAMQALLNLWKDDGLHEQDIFFRVTPADGELLCDAWETPDDLIADQMQRGEDGTPGLAAFAVNQFHARGVWQGEV